MYDKAQFEIPEAVRELAERNVEQARSAYSQFMDMARKAQDAVTKSQGAMAAGALDIQSKALCTTPSRTSTRASISPPISRAPAISRSTSRSRRAMRRSRCRTTPSRPRTSGAC